jgi:hypothetical protein
MTVMRHVLITLLLLLSAAPSFAQQESSANPTLKDYWEVQRFRQVYYPLLNQDLPNRDYEALISTAPVLETAAKQYGEMKYSTHNNDKHQAFVDRRDSLSVLVKAYVDAALQYDSATVLELLPLMKEQFEQSAEALVPYDWPEYNRLRASTEELYYSLIGKMPKGGTEAKIDPVQAVDTIAARMAEFVASPGPQEVQYRSSLIAETKTYYTKLVGEVKALAVSPDGNKFRDKVTELKVRLVNFERWYLQ